ncbi:VOC family protein [Kutzneria kofuensis]|uniref:Catechol 2,3-dioxygenase-like lactoylglutathione lyase family enzyme n=1 Tax=Kutzneria kofuensis TaxID=103725 RepID=A0A7W9KBZ2_9PSEU|nr:VOC family protein [Kutzneria kofuensis]MBB5889813.1 catechol 2,3-dioxygenase-like lactoylglutathione lyase family enzyme [Kutzneria kofuensis]
MACRISEIVVEARDPERLAAFWAEVLGYVVIGREGNAVEIGPPDTGFGGPQPTLVFDRTNDAPRVKLPLHLDVNPTDRDQEDELARLLAIGARHADVGQTGDESWYVLADPEGNEFCLLRRRIDPVSQRARGPR